MGGDKFLRFPMANVLQHAKQKKITQRPKLKISFLVAAFCLRINTLIPKLSYFQMDHSHLHPQGDFKRLPR